MGHWSNAKCHIAPDLYDIWHLTSDPLAFGFHLLPGSGWMVVFARIPFENSV